MQPVSIWLASACLFPTRKCSARHFHGADLSARSCFSDYSRSMPGPEKCQQSCGRVQLLDPPSSARDNLRRCCTDESRHPPPASQEFNMSDETKRIGDYEILNELGVGGMG